MTLKAMAAKEFFLIIKSKMIFGAYVILKKIVYPLGTKGRLDVQTKPTLLAT